MKASILIVDDEFGLAELIADVLTDQGYETTVAVNGQQALTYLSEKAIDLVIVDLMMPVLNGPELVTRMRASEAQAHIPVIAMTTVPQEAGRGVEYGAVLRKPFSSAELLKAVREILAGTPLSLGRLS